MKEQIDQMLHAYECGWWSRRELVGAVAALATVGVGGAQARGASEGAPTFTATGLNHLALRVTDVERSRDFYVRHLGLEVASQSLPASCFLDCGANFVALFRSAEAGMHHYCYSIPDYRQQDAAARLRGVGIEPRLEANRIYFQDPDGLTVQLADERG